MHAAQSKNSELISYLITHKEDVGAKDRNRNTALHLAALVGHEDSIYTLLKYGAGVSSRNLDGETPLLLAARNGHVSAVKALLKGRSNISSKAANGNTAFLEACLSGNVELLPLLVEMGADKLDCNAVGMNGVHIAVCGNNDHTVGVLHELGVGLSTMSNVYIA